MTARCPKPTLYVTEDAAYGTAALLFRLDGQVRQVERCRECGGYHVGPHVQRKEKR